MNLKLEISYKLVYNINAKNKSDIFKFTLFFKEKPLWFM